MVLFQWRFLSKREGCNNPTRVRPVTEIEKAGLQILILKPITINTNKSLLGICVSFWSQCWCEIPERLAEPAVANMGAEIKPRHPLCPFITPSAPLLAATSPSTLRLGDNGSGGWWRDLHLDQWDICTGASEANDVVLGGVKRTQMCTAGLRPQKLYRHDLLATIKSGSRDVYLYPFLPSFHFNGPLSVLQVRLCHGNTQRCFH